MVIMVKFSLTLTNLTKRYNGLSVDHGEYFKFTVGFHFDGSCRYVCRWYYMQKLYESDTTLIMLVCVTLILLDAYMRATHTYGCTHTDTRTLGWQLFVK